MMKAVRGDSIERIYLIVPYMMHYHGIYFLCMCMKKTMKKQIKNT